MTIIHRVKDNLFAYSSQYVSSYSQKKIKVYVHTDKVQEGAETKSRLVDEVAKRCFNQNPSDISSLRFRYGGKKWKVVQTYHVPLFFRILAFIFPFIHLPSNHGIVHLKLEPAYFAPEEEQKFTLNEANHLALKASVSWQDYEKGVRRIKSIPQKCDQSELRSQFTEMAAAAFQKYETHFIDRDDYKPENCDLRFIVERNEIKLVKKGSPLVNCLNKIKAAELFKTTIIQAFGIEKVRYIGHLYGIDYENLKELTPEHIYRFNVGTLNVEGQDLESLVKSLQKISFGEHDVSSKVKPLLKEIPGVYRERILKFLGSKDATVTDFIEKLGFTLSLSLKTEEWTSSDFQNILRIVNPTDEERKKAYTGKKIRFRIEGAYTLAEHNSFKPWVDQLELSQIFKTLIHSKSKEAYRELLSHVVVKKHLVREHPTEGYRVGALIPGIRKKDGEIPYYKVSSLMTNGYCYCYVLESACQGQDLNPILVFRNTSPALYALYSKKSLEDDFNPYNSPGKVGEHQVFKYFKQFLRQFTIPIWVGYLLSAIKRIKENDSIEKVVEDLESSVTLLEKQHSQEKTKYFGDTLKKHDMILLKLLKLKKIDQTIQDQFIEKYILNRDEEDRNEIEAFIRSLQNVKGTLPSREQLLTQELLDDLTSKPVNNTLLPDFLAPIRNAKNNTELTTYAQVVIDHLQNFAKDADELSEEKRFENIETCAHSLGASRAFAIFVKELAKEGRMLLPNKQIHVSCYGSPGINAEDNKAFKEWGNQHAELFERLSVPKFSMFKLHEASDIVLLGGEVPAGAVYSNAEQDKVMRWLNFKGRFCEKLKTSSHKEVAFSPGSHLTRFLNAEMGKDFNAASFDLKTLGIFNRWDKVFKKEQNLEVEFEHWKLRKEFWKIPTWANIYLHERRRKIPGVIMQWILNRFLGIHLPSREPDPKYIDPHGNFVVKLREGVVTKYSFPL